MCFWKSFYLRWQNNRLSKSKAYREPDCQHGNPIRVQNSMQRYYQCLQDLSKRGDSRMHAIHLTSFQPNGRNTSQGDNSRFLLDRNSDLMEKQIKGSGQT